jgi:hypothetical protein
LKKDLQIAKVNSDSSQQKQKKYADTRRREAVFKEGEQVLVSTRNLKLINGQTAKLRKRFIGPFKVIQVLSDLNYKLDLPNNLKVHPTFHISQLKKFITDPSFNRDPVYNGPPPQQICDDEVPIYEVDKILDKRGVGNKVQYLVLWKGYPEWEATWEPLSNLDGSSKAIAAFEQSRGTLSKRGRGRPAHINSITGLIHRSESSFKGGGCNGPAYFIWYFCIIFTSLYSPCFILSVFVFVSSLYRFSTCFYLCLYFLFVCLIYSFAFALPIHGGYLDPSRSPPRISLSAIATS